MSLAAAAIGLMCSTSLTVTLSSAGRPIDRNQTTHEPRAKTTLTFLAGAAVGLGVHEAGHVVVGAALGAHPRVKGIHYGNIPFFAIDHDATTRRKELAISSAGFWMQHAGSEWLLTTHPHLRDEREPFLKGVFAFHLAASAVYSVAAFGTLGPPERDTRGIAVSAGEHGVPEPAVGAIVLAPAALDVYRYYRPDAVWAKWAGRASKVAMIALLFTVR